MAIKVKLLPRWPAAISATAPIVSTTANGALELSYDSSSLTTTGSVSGTAKILLRDGAVYEEILASDVSFPPFPDQRLLGNVSGGTATASALTGTQTNTVLPAFTGDSGGGGVKGLVPAPNAGDAAAGRFLAAGGTFSTPPAPTIANNTILGNISGSSTAATALTGAQTNTVLPAFTGDSGSGGVKGLVPAPSAGDAAAGRFLAAGGTFTAPTFTQSGTGAVSRLVTAKIAETISVTDFGAVGDGTTDNSSAFTDCFAAAIGISGNRAVSVYIPAGQYLLNSQVVATIPGYGTPTGTQYNGITIHGDGQNATKLIAGASNTAGLLKIVTPYEKHSITLRDFQCISKLDAQTNTGANNGVAIWISSQQGTTANPLPGLNNEVSVTIKNIYIGSDDFSEGNAQLFYSVWNRAIQIDYQWTPTIDHVTINIPTDKTLAAFNYSGNYEAGIYLLNCYNPQLIKVNVHGLFQSGLWHGKALTAPGNPGRPEGGLIIGSEFGSCMDGIVIDMAYNAEPSIYPPLFRIIGCDFNNNRYCIRTNYYQMIVISACTFFVPITGWIATAGYPSTGSNLVGPIYLNNSADVKIADCFMGGSDNGYLTSTTNTAFGVRLDGTTSYVDIDGIIYNASGYTVYANTTASGNAYDLQRSIRVRAKSMGKRSATRTNVPVYDPNGVVLFLEDDQTATIDSLALTGKNTGSAFSPVYKIDRLRTDYATPATGISLGSVEFGALARGGNRFEAIRLAATFADNTPGSETTKLDMQAYVAGALTTLIQMDGAAALNRLVRTWFSGPARLQSYTVAGVPSASFEGSGAMIYVSNESGGAVIAFSDGTNWRRVTDRAIIS
jgi:hypothetical protein